ncbi:MAG: Flp family type IVb pilin [Actinomycetes bacterium]
MTELYIKSRNAVLAEASAEDGATAVEYGLIIALIAAVIVVVVVALGTDIKAAFQKVVDAI